MRTTGGARGEGGEGGLMVVAVVVMVLVERGGGWVGSCDVTAMAILRRVFFCISFPETSQRVFVRRIKNSSCSHSHGL